jgi:hypothetical protein
MARDQPSSCTISTPNLAKVRSISGNCSGALFFTTMVAAGDRAQRQEGGDLVEVFVEAELAAPQRAAAVHGHARGAHALDAHAQHGHEAAELLHVRLAAAFISVEVPSARAAHSTKFSVVVTEA